jgi:L-ribulose-5-phosphate 4-epimerase
MTLHELKVAVLEANLAVQRAGLVRLTWGNVSGVDRASGCLVIKPSGVDYAALRAENMVVVRLSDGQVLEGDLRPSSDTPTHLALYRAWPKIGGVCHTHSPHATSWSQAGRSLPCYGTTHADHFYGPVPICRALTPEEVAADYEGLTGQAIVDHFAQAGLDPMSVPAVLQAYHAPFTWGKSPLDAVNNSIALEMCAQMAAQVISLAPETPPLPQHLLDKHFLRKHGPGAYYGQK